jgi:hypothetical protein
MALTKELQAMWDKLVNSPRQSFAIAIRHTPDDTSMEAPGIYVVWDGDKPIYIGTATLTRPDGGRKSRLWGLKDRLKSHQRGQLSGSSLATGIWFCRIAPKLSIEDHQKVADRILSPNSLTEEAIQKLEYSCVVVKEKGLESIESALWRDQQTEINAYQEFLKTDNVKRTKARRDAKKVVADSKKAQDALKNSF